MHKRHALTFVTITVFLDTVGFSVIVPLLLEFLVLIGDVSLSDTSALSGYLIFSYAVTNFMFAPMLGNLSDACGRKPLLGLLSLSTEALTYCRVSPRRCGCCSWADCLRVLPAPHMR